MKISIFKPLTKIIEFKFQSLDAEKLNVKEMCDVFLEEFTCGKSSQTVKSCILQLLGLFSEYFPDLMSTKAKHIQQLLMESLQKQFKSAKPDMQIIAGSLKGITSLLVAFHEDFTMDQSQQQKKTIGKKKNLK